MDVLHGFGVDDEAIIALQTDLGAYPFPDKERALLELADELTLAPARADEAARAALAAGWTPKEVAHAVFVVSYFNMTTRIADAFDLTPDDRHRFDPEAPLPWRSCGAP